MISNNIVIYVWLSSLTILDFYRFWKENEISTKLTNKKNIREYIKTDKKEIFKFWEDKEKHMKAENFINNREENMKDYKKFYEEEKEDHLETIKQGKKLVKELEILLKDREELKEKIKVLEKDLGMKEGNLSYNNLLHKRDKQKLEKKINELEEELAKLKKKKDK